VEETEQGHYRLCTLKWQLLVRTIILYDVIDTFLGQKQFFLHLELV